MERRLAAILAADVVGYSRLIEQDEASTFERLRAHRKELFEPEVEKHHGRIFKLMGDGLLAEFGSVVDAVECAVALQRSMGERNGGLADGERIDVRIGINLGDVILEGEDRHGEGVVIAARLQQLADPGGIAVSRTVADHVKHKLALRFELQGEELLKNIAEPVAVYRVLIGASTAGAKARSIKAWVRSRRANAALIGALLALAMMGGATVWWRPWEPKYEPASPERIALPLPDKPSIAVLPFDNRSGDQRLGRLADGMVEDIIVNLSRFRELFVIAQNSSFVYRDKPTDVRQIGRDLGVRYVLEGHIRSSTKGLTVDAQLIDATAGTLVWSQDYDGPLDDLFKVQADIASRIAGSIGGALGALRRAVLDVAHRRSPQSLEAYDLFLLGNEARLRIKQEELGKSMELLRRAVDLDPTFQPAHVGLAMGHWMEVDYGWAPFQ